MKKSKKSNFIIDAAQRYLSNKKLKRTLYEQMVKKNM